MGSEMCIRDRAIGAGALAKVDFSRGVLVSSARQTGDMVLKVATVGIPILVSISAPLSSGVKMATKTGVTLIGFVRDLRANIYTYPKRVKLA